jgi:hypothetical protein
MIFKTNAVANSTNPTRGGFNFQTPAATSSLFITNEANVGIGTDSPGAKLDVRKGGTTAAQGDTDLIVQDSTAASSTAQVQILGGATGYSNLYFSDTAAYNVGGFIYNHTDNYLATNVNGSEKMRIDSSGNVGIGVTPWVSTLPNTIIDINPVASIWGYANSVYLNSNAYYNSGWLYKSTAAAGVLQVDGDILRFRAAASGTADAGIAFDVPFIVDSGGNVGIGTTTPQKKVHIEGTGGASEMQILVSSASDTVGHTAGIGLRGEGGEADGDLRIKGGIFFERIAGSFGNGKMILAVNSSVSNTSVTVADHALTIDTNKNVGIGVTDPEKKLEVKSDTTYDGIMLDVLSNPEITFRDRGNSDTLVGTGRHALDGFHIDTYSGNAFFIKGSNRFVGIGTTSPGTALAFGGFGSIWVNNDTTNPFGMDTVGGELRLFVGGGSAAYQMKFGKYDGTTFTPYMTIGDDGSNPSYVGIGTDSPGAKLDVVVSNVSTTPNSESSAVFRRNGNNYITILSNSSNEGGILFGNSTDNNDASISYGHNTQAMSFATADAERMRIDSSGNVGIGKTTSLATHKLSILKGASNQQLGLYYDETNVAMFGAR